jgi:hypothetical protein
MAEEMTEREARVAATVQDMGRAARAMVDLALAFDKACAQSDQAELMDSAEKLAAFGTEFSGLYRRLLVTWLRQPRSSRAGHEMSST